MIFYGNILAQSVSKDFSVKEVVDTTIGSAVLGTAGYAVGKATEKLIENLKNKIKDQADGDFAINNKPDTKTLVGVAGISALTLGSAYGLGAEIGKAVENKNPHGGGGGSYTPNPDYSKVDLLGNKMKESKSTIDKMSSESKERYQERVKTAEPEKKVEAVKTVSEPEARPASISPTKVEVKAEVPKEVQEALSKTPEPSNDISSRYGIGESDSAIQLKGARQGTVDKAIKAYGSTPQESADKVVEALKADDNLTYEHVQPYLGKYYDDETVKLIEKGAKDAGEIGKITINEDGAAVTNKDWNSLGLSKSYTNSTTYSPSEVTNEALADAANASGKGDALRAAFEKGAENASAVDPSSSIDAGLSAGDIGVLAALGVGAGIINSNRQKAKAAEEEQMMMRRMAMTRQPGMIPYGGGM